MFCECVSCESHLLLEPSSNLGQIIDERYDESLMIVDY